MKGSPEAATGVRALVSTNVPFGVLQVGNAVQCTLPSFKYNHFSAILPCRDVTSHLGEVDQPFFPPNMMVKSPRTHAHMTCSDFPARTSGRTFYCFSLTIDILVCRFQHVEVNIMFR